MNKLYLLKNEEGDIFARFNTRAEPVFQSMVGGGVFVIFDLKESCEGTQRDLREKFNTVTAPVELIIAPPVKNTVKKDRARQNNMPQELIDFLSELPDETADDIWKWLDDGTPMTTEEMVKVIADTHPDL